MREKGGPERNSCAVDRLKKKIKNISLGIMCIKHIPAAFAGEFC